MNYKEFKRLRAFTYARSHQPKNTYQGRRTVKGQAKGYGQVLKKSDVYSMSVETQHFQRKVY